ncbi:MAG: hypothetical protein J7501_08480 [Bdellovibrio sp.]|nr:hypothetical protein [Bdellovibrio sp.]
MANQNILNQQNTQRPPVEKGTEKKPEREIKNNDTKKGTPDINPTRKSGAV